QIANRCMDPHPPNVDLRMGWNNFRYTTGRNVSQNFPPFLLPDVFQHCPTFRTQKVYPNQQHICIKGRVQCSFFPFTFIELISGANPDPTQALPSRQQTASVWDTPAGRITPSYAQTY